MDITDTTATSDEVLDGKVFYAASGTRSVGTLGDATQSSHGLMSSTDKTKLDNISVMQGATADDNGVQGLVPAPTSDDRYKFLAGDGTYRSGGLPMVILSYGHSTWDDFIEAYNNNVIVYCRASSQTNPASGDQTRMAFMAYVNATPPTYVEFQYYRSVSSHSYTQMCDEVYIYGLREDIGWTVSVRQAGIKRISGASEHVITTPIKATYTASNSTVTLYGGLPTVNSNDNGKILKVVNGAWALVDPT